MPSRHIGIVNHRFTGNGSAINPSTGKPDWQRSTVEMVKGYPASE
jgi:hypothetical protein